jgi:hypothetical protein
MAEVQDPLDFIERLNAEALREQIRDLDRRRLALSVLLKAAAARERSAARQKEAADHATR